nr:hypothetical protein [Tanacetum cinerariifolium]
IVEKTNVSRSKEKVVVSSDSEESEADDFSKLKKITALLAKKQEFVKSDGKQVVKKDDLKKRDMSRVKCYNYKKEGHFAKDYKKAKVNDYEYYKTKMLLAKKDKDEQVLFAEDQAWMESSSDSDREINANMEGHFAKDYKKAKVNDYEYYKTKMLLAKKDKDEQVLFAEDQAWMESSSDS